MRSRSEPTRLGQVFLVHDEQVAARDPGAALARDVVAAGHVDHEDLHVGERRAEDRGQVVAAALDHARGRAGPRPRSSSATASRLAETSSRIAVCGQPPVSTARIRSAGQHAGAAQEERVLGRVDVVRDARRCAARRRASGRARPRASSCRSRPARRCRGGRARSAGKEPPLARGVGERAQLQRGREAAGQAARIVGHGCAASSCDQRRRLDEPARGAAESTGAAARRPRSPSSRPRRGRPARRRVAGEPPRRATTPNATGRGVAVLASR